MRTPMPRLVKDSKTAIWFFRWSLPIALQQSLNRKSLYISLKTRNLRLAQCLAGVLNLRVETMKKLPNLNEANLRKMLEIDLDRGIFRADKGESNTHFNYLHELPPSTLQEAVEALDFHGTIDFQRYDWREPLANILRRTN
jgi:hypothetical protein